MSKDKIKAELQKESIRAIENSLCEKCRGVIVNSWISSMMAVSYGKRCECKKSSPKRKKLRKKR